MPPPVHHDSYQMHLKQIGEASVAHAEENMKSAISRLKSTLKDSGDISDDDENDDENDEACVDVGVSCDGSWHRRGFSSLVGTAAAISLETGQVLDYEILNKVCYECRHWKMCLILIQRRRHGLTSTVKFVPSITLDLLLEWKQLVLVECGSIQKKRTDYDIQLFLVMVIVSRFPLFHRKYHTLWLKLIV